MAFLISPHKLKGKVDDMVYCSTEEGIVAKGKGGATPEQVKHSPSMENTRRLNRDFAEAAHATKLLRLALGRMEDSVMSGKMIGRLNSLFGRVAKEDMFHDWGARRVPAGDLALLAGFEFNHKLSLDEALPLNIDNYWKIGAGKMDLGVPAFRIRKKDELPAAATHYKLVSCVLTIDFDSRQYTRTKVESELYAMGRKAGGAFDAGHALAPDNTKGCLWLVGIEFYKMENDKAVLVKGGALRMMEWIDITYPGLYEREVPEVEVDEICRPMMIESLMEDCLVEEEEVMVQDEPVFVEVVKEAKVMVQVALPEAAVNEAEVVVDEPCKVTSAIVDVSSLWEQAIDDHDRVETYAEESIIFIHQHCSYI